MSTSISAFDMISEETQSLVKYPSDLLDEEWEILQPIINELEPYILLLYDFFIEEARVTV